MSSVFPGSTDDFTDREDNVDPVVAADHNDVIDAVEKIEQTIGTNPAGAYDTISDRLDALAGWENEFPVPDTEVTLSEDNVGSHGTLDEHVKDTAIHGSVSSAAYEAMLQLSLDAVMRGALATGFPSLSAEVDDAVMPLAAGDLAFCYPTAGPSGSGYALHIVTAEATGVSSGDLRLDDESSAPTFASSSLFTKLTPDAAVDVSDTTLALSSGDVVLCSTTANPSGSGYALRIVTVGAAGVSSSSLRLNGAGAAPTFAASSRLSRLTTTATAGVTDSTMVITAGDVVMCYPTANPAGSGYALHMVTTGATGVNSSALRLDDEASAPTFSASSRFTIMRPSTTALVSDTAMPLVPGDVVYCYPTANPSGSAYGFHVVTAAAVGVSDSALRLDGQASAPTFSSGSRLSKMVPTYQGIARGGEVIDIVYVPDWMLVTTKGTGTGGGGTSPAVYGNLTTRFPLPPCRGDSEFTGEVIDLTGLGNPAHSTALRMRIPAIAGDESAYFPEVGMRLELNSSAGDCRGRKGAGITNLPTFSGASACEDNPTFAAFAPGLDASIDWLAVMPLLGRVADAGMNGRLSVGEYVMVLAASASDSASAEPFISSDDESTNAVDLFKVPSEEPYFGTGVDGALVIDGTTPASSTDGKAHPSGNVAVPSGVTHQTVAGTLSSGNYYYKITAYNEHGETTPTGEILHNLGATGGVRLDWSASPGADGYKLYRWDGSKFGYMATVSGVTWTDDGTLTPGSAVPPTSNTAERAYRIDTVKNYTTVTVQNGGVISCSAWSGGPVGGRIVINATGAVTIDATSSITAEGKGYRGGAGDYNGGGYQGESSTGVGAQSTSSNGGGGGGAAYGSGNVAGGAGYGEAGTGSSGQGGAAYGTADLAILYLGSGGGGSSSSGYATGGSGGGAIRICAASISVFGSICCDGNDGVNNSGAGSGGSIYLRARTLNLGEGRVTALGGANHPGGDGRIRLDYNTLTGQTDPVPGFTLFMAEGSANFYGNNHTHKAEDISSGVFPISRGGTGQTAKTAAFDALAPTTTKGDLIVFNGVDNVREPVGSDNQVLIADSAQETGVKWGNLPAHNSAHQSGGADAIKLDNLAAPADNTDLDATSSAHGLCPKLSGTSTQYLSGTGQWTTPSGSGGGTPGGTDGQVQYNDDGDFGGLAEGTAGQVLTSNGAGVAPSFQNPSRSIAYNYPMILEKTLDYLFRESSYQGISVGGEIIELVCLPKHGIITTAGTNVSTQQIPNGYSNPTTKMPLGSNWSDTNFDGDKIVQNGFFDWSGVGDHWKTVFPYYSDRQSIAWAEGLQLILNSTTAAARGRRGAGVYNRTAGSGWGTVDGYPVAWWSSPMLNSGSVGKMTIFPCVARVIDPGDNEDISEGDLVLFIACNCEGSSAVMFSSGAASGSPPSESTACDIFAIPENCLS